MVFGGEIYPVPLSIITMSDCIFPSEISSLILIKLRYNLFNEDY